MGISLFPGMKYATNAGNGSQVLGDMQAGFYIHDNITGGFCKVGRDEEGASLNRAEHMVACIALEMHWNMQGPEISSSYFRTPSVS